MTQNNKVRIVILGGLGSFGKNCTVLEYGDDILIVDAGLQFPTEEMPGVDIVIPDFSYLEERRHQVRGIVITHGHEDHIGALPYLLREVHAPIYATPLTRGLIEGKLRSRTRRREIELHTSHPGEEIEVGAFRVTPFHVNHSIPDSVGLAIRTPVGLIVHSGDFKIDHTPIEGVTTDLGSLASLSSEGVLLLMSDSTNAESPGYTESESVLRDTFHRVFARAEGRIIVATFASLLSRIQLVIETAAQFGRKVAVAGRSMVRNVSIAEDLGYLHFPPHTRIRREEIRSLDDNQVCVLATGSQGEPNAALARMASGRFHHLDIKETDTVVLSAKSIPGNETQIYRNIDNLSRRGAQVVYGQHAGLHVSGHAAQEELKLMLNLLQPRHFMPIHGAYRMLQAHARLAYELGFDRDDVFVLDSGDSLELYPSYVQRGESVDVNRMMVDGSLVGDVGSTILRDRMTLAQDGFVVARAILDPESGKVVDSPDIISQGFVYVPESTDLIESAQNSVAQLVERLYADGEDFDVIEEEVRRRLADLFYHETRRRPVIVSVVTIG